MGIQRRILKSCILFVGDVTALYAALFLMLIIRYAGPAFDYYVRIHLFSFSIIFGALVTSFYISNLYELRTVKNSPAFYDRLYRVFFFNAAIAISVFYLLPYFRITPRANLFIVIIISFLMITAWRWTAQSIMSAKGASRVLFFGLSKEVVELADLLRQNPQLGYLPAVIMTEGDEHVSQEIPLKNYSFSSHLPEIIKNDGIEVVVASPEIKKNEALVALLFQVVPLGIPVVDFLSFYESITGKMPIALVKETWFLENLVGVKKDYYEFSKRCLDIAIAMLIGAPSLALFPFIALAIIASKPQDILRYRKKRARPGDGIIFFSQKRVGKNGNIFQFIKFRSQVLGAEKMGEIKSHAQGTGDPRKYPVGTFLRTYYLDELPQIWNVLKGEMSFVGPRPERPEFVQNLKKEIPFYEMRLLVTPGITGWAQVNMENDASVEDALEKLQYDLAYIKNRSIWLDMSIALRTIRTMLSRGGR